MKKIHEAKQFYTHEALEYGVDKAILINYLRLFIMGNKARSQHEYDGRTYTYATHQEIANRHPFWSKKKVSRMVASLVEAGVIIVGYFAENPWDRTSYYAFVDEESFLFGGDRSGTSDVDTGETSDVDTGGTSSYTKDKLKNTKYDQSDLVDYFVGRGADRQTATAQAASFTQYWFEEKSGFPGTGTWKQYARTWFDNGVKYGRISIEVDALTPQEFAERQLRSVREGVAFNPSEWYLHSESNTWRRK